MIIDRRVLLAIGASFALPGSGETTEKMRLAALDYALAETAIAIGATPVAVANASAWDTWVVEPQLPGDVVDIGIDLNVNLELLAALRPDLILTTDYVATQENALQRIAPVLNISIYDGSATPLERAKIAARTIGNRIGRSEGAERLIRDTTAILETCRRKLSSETLPPVLLISFMDPRHVRVYGDPGLFDNVLKNIGVRNAWTETTNAWGFATVGIEDLADLGDALPLVVEPVPPDVFPTLERSPIWTEMPMVKRYGTRRLPAALMFGALPSAQRFARLVTKALATAA